LTLRGRTSLTLTMLILALSACGGVVRSIEIPRPPTQQGGTPVSPTLTGYIVRPEGPGPFGAVILLHGCSGLGLETTHKATWNRKLEWAEWYRSRGYVALVVDSFGPRRLTNEVCGDGRVTPFERALDAYDALGYLAALPFVRQDRVVVQGLSHGGSTVLRALDDVLFGRAPNRFAGGIAYYPACSGVRPALYAPALVLTGELDDWTPAAPCAALGQRSQGERYPIDVTVYPRAYHAFDFPGPRSVNRWGKILEYNAPATADAERRVDAFLRRFATPR
jgi:dienelactone hydrolase